MKKPLFFLLILAAVVFYGWKNTSENHHESKQDTAKAIHDDNYYTLKEGFEEATKAAYKKEEIRLKSGIWTMDDALIGNLKDDVFIDAAAARLRNGEIAMNFDLDSLFEISLSYALFGNDQPTTFKVMVSYDGANPVQLGEDILVTSSTLKTSSFPVDATKKASIRIVKTGNSRINIDDIIFKSAMPFSFSQDSLIDLDAYTKEEEAAKPEKDLPSRDRFRGNDAPPAIGENSNMFFGNPSNASVATPDNYLIDQVYYTESYNRKKGIPNWVSWHLDKSNITNKAKRGNNFAAFEALPQGWYQVQSNSYAESGFDRGHNCPSGDRTSSVSANSATFLMTNMIPQAPENNQKCWNAFEEYLRGEVRKNNEIYVVMGVYGTGGYGTKGKRVNDIDEGRIGVPAHIWKIAVILPEGTHDAERVKTEAKIIAIDTPNENVLSYHWQKYIVTIRELENATGYNFLSALPKNVQSKLENTAQMIP